MTFIKYMIFDHHIVTMWQIDNGSLFYIKGEKADDWYERLK